MAAPALAMLAPAMAMAAPAASLMGLHPGGADSYTRYELLEPGSGKFRILYDLTQFQPGAALVFNPIRKGSVASEETVIYRASGLPLKFSVVSGAAAQTSGFAKADPSYDYIRVELSRPVPPEGGEARIHIGKTYFDPKSYTGTGSTITFARSLGVKRNAVVLPKGFILSTCNYPSQVDEENDGRIRISFLNTTPAEAPLVVTARRAGPPPSPAPGGAPASERAAETRDIVYALGPPASHAFDLYHDYTEERPGVGSM